MTRWLTHEQAPLPCTRVFSLPQIMACVTLVYDRHDRSSGDLHLWERMGNPFVWICMPGIPRLSRLGPNQVQALGCSKAGKVDMSEVGGTRPKDFHQGGGREECGESGSWIGERTQQRALLYSDQPNWQLGRATMPSLWRRKYMLVIQRSHTQALFSLQRAQHK